MTMTNSQPKSLLQLLSCAALAIPLASCITVKAPEKPIEINLNVAITQEVLVRLQRDVEQLITQNPQAFPQTPGPGTTPQ
jgi:ABC-type uncharacterized transport system auxiliary subunit